MSDEITVDEVGENAYKFVMAYVDRPNINQVDLNHLLSVFSEAGIWPFDNIDLVSNEQAIMCWQIVERLRELKGQLPENCIL